MIDFSFEWRMDIKNQWVKAAKHVAELASYPEALGLASFIEKEIILVAMQGKSVVASESSRSGKWFGFLPIAQDDPCLQFEEFKVQATGWYRHCWRSIVVRDYVPLSSLWKGILMLHESFHAKDLLDVPTSSNRGELLFVDERRAHTFENQLVSALGGKAYAEMLDRTVSDALKECESSSPHVLPFYDHVMDDVFGHPQSNSDLGLRKSHLYVHANFLAIERSCVVDKDRQKELFLKGAHEKYADRRVW